MSTDDEDDTPPTRPGRVPAIVQTGLRSDNGHLSLCAYPGSGTIVIRQRSGDSVSIAAGDAEWVANEIRRLLWFMRRMLEDG